MLFPLCLLATTAAASVAMIIAALRRAPEAYEDQDGLQIIRQDSCPLVHSPSRPVIAKAAIWHVRHELVRHLMDRRKTAGRISNEVTTRPTKKHWFSQPIPGFVGKP